MRNKTVAILGASSNPERYANMAQRLLMEGGYTVVPVSRGDGPILGLDVVEDLRAYKDSVDTVTLYIGSGRVPTVLDAILEKRPRRVIFNPGTENEEARALLEGAGIETVEACTLVLLRTGQFED